MTRAELPTDADFQQTKQLKTTTAALEDLYVPSRPLSSSTTWFLFRQPSLSLFYLLFSFPLVSYTLLLLGESDGGLVPRHREEQDDLAGTAPSSPSLKTCARDQSVEGLRKRFDIVSKLATPSLFPKHQKSTEAKINKRRGGQTDKEGVSPFRLVDISQHNPSDGRSDPEILRRRRKNSQQFKRS